MTETAEDPKSLKEIVQFAEKRFNEISPAGMLFHKESNFAMQILQNSAYLMKVAEGCPRSITSALVNVAALGLSLNPAKKEAYLIPRNIKTSEGKWESRIFLEPSYMGMVNMATDTGSIDWVQARVVRMSDKFTDNGVGEKPTHIFDAFAADKDRGEIVGVYCVAKTGSDYLVTIMNKEKLDSIRDRSEVWKKDKSGPWATDGEEMSKKSVIRQGFKTWPKTDRFARMEQAVHLSNENEGFEPLLINPEISQATAEQKEFFSQLITNNDSIGMFCFMTSLDSGVQTDLYNSFERGSITKYKTLVREMLASGGAQIKECLQVVEESAANEDDLGIREILEDLSQEAVDWIKNNVQDEALAFINSIDK